MSHTWPGNRVLAHSEPLIQASTVVCSCRAGTWYQSGSWLEESHYLSSFPLIWPHQLQQTLIYDRGLPSEQTGWHSLLFTDAGASGLSSRVCCKLIFAQWTWIIHLLQRTSQCLFSRIRPLKRASLSALPDSRLRRQTGVGSQWTMLWLAYPDLFWLNQDSFLLESGWTLPSRSQERSFGEEFRV